MPFKPLPENEGIGNKRKWQISGLDKQREHTKKCHSTPVTDVKPGDVIHNVGLVVGTDFLSLVTGVGEPDADGNVEVFQTHYPLIWKVDDTAKQMWDVHGRDEEALEMALKMFSSEE